MAVNRMFRWVPAVFLAGGGGLLGLVQRQQITPLAVPLSEMPREVLGFAGKDNPVSLEEQRIAGMSSFVMRVFYDGANRSAFSVYVGYYEAQVQGKSIHSPKNCLPGAGWEPLSAGTAVIPAGNGRQTVNRYLLANGNATALVYYWYQGRGRVQANEYAVKWDLLRDKALHGRSEEALVRVIVRVDDTGVAQADSLASRVSGRLIAEVQKHLPAFSGRSLAGN